MIIKQSFQFLNTLGFCLKHKMMFLARQSYKIYRAVVGWNSVKVMNMPTFRQELSVRCFPNKTMLKEPVGSEN